MNNKIKSEKFVDLVCEYSETAAHFSFLFIAPILLLIGVGQLICHASGILELPELPEKDASQVIAGIVTGWLGFTVMISIFLWPLTSCILAFGKKIHENGRFRLFIRKLLCYDSKCVIKGELEEAKQRLKTLSQGCTNQDTLMEIGKTISCLERAEEQFIY